MRWSEYANIGRGPITWLVTDEAFEAIFDVQVETGLDDVDPNDPPPPPDDDPRVIIRKAPPVRDIPPGGVGDDPPVDDGFLICIGPFESLLNMENDWPVGDTVVEHVGEGIPVGSSEIVFKEVTPDVGQFVLIGGVQSAMNVNGDWPIGDYVADQVNGAIPIGALELEVQEN